MRDNKRDLSINKNKTAVIIYCISILYSFFLLFSIYYLNFGFFPLFWLIGMLILKPLYRSDSYWMDASFLLILWLIVRGGAGYYDSYIYVPFVMILLIYAAHKIENRIVPFFNISLIIMFFAVVLLNDFKNMNFNKYFLIITAITGIITYLINVFQAGHKITGAIDFILCSYSGNTGHLSNTFIESAQKAGSRITLHRFHYYKDFTADLTGDSLVLAFPVIGWKPPWHLMEYLLKDLPRGHGKPAFILYSSYGGPENAGFIAWLLLTLKGYNVIGRNWVMYPLNVATFRIGTAALWKWIDKKTPSKKDIEDIIECGKNISLHRKTGLPVIFLPFLLFIAGVILENRWINIFLYRNYAWRRRCNKCGLCVNSCPSERLFFDNNSYPAARGTCALCLLCVNICPTNAMQMRFWTEYGHPYQSRWPEYVVKHKNNLNFSKR